MRHAFAKPSRLAFVATAILALCAGPLAGQTGKPAADGLSGASEDPLFAPAPTPAPPAVPSGSTAPAAAAASSAPTAEDATENVASATLQITPKTSVVIQVSPSRTTTVMFPFIIDDVQGSFFTPDPKAYDGDYVVTVRKYYISLTILSAKPIPRNLNIISDNRIYTLEVKPVLTGAPVPASVYLTLPGAPADGGSNGSSAFAAAAVPGGAPPSAVGQPPAVGGTAGGNRVGLPLKRSASPPTPTLKPSGGARLLGVLDALKTIMGLESAEAQAQAAALMQDVTFTTVRKPQDNDQLDWKVSVTHVMRRQKLDAVAFALRITNTSARPLHLDLESGAVRVGDSSKGLLLRATLGDVPAVIPPGQTLPAYLVCVGTSSGAPNWISPDNRFTVSFAERSFPAGAPASGQGARGRAGSTASR